MNLENIINAIETVDPEFQAQTNNRRDALKNFAGFAGKAALMAVPLTFSSMLKKAYGQTSSTSVIDVLNFALTLEYLEAEFYQMGRKANMLIPEPSDSTDLAIIGAHEREHVLFLQSAIKSAGGMPIEKPKFDFSGGAGKWNGPFKNVFSDYKLFLAVAQTLEDTGVRAYKGQAGNLKGTGAVLTAALNIHSVEARHASHIRNMRMKQNNTSNLRPWITGKDTGGIGSLVQANYNGEDNTVQLGIQIKGINGQNITYNDATEAFDEPLSKQQVLELVVPFLAK